MKKGLAIALIMTLVIGAAFAAKGDIKVGAQVGWGFDWMRMNKTQTILDHEYTGIEITKYNGLSAVLTGEYDITDAIGVKLEAGINLMGKQKNISIWKKDGVVVSEEVVDDPDTTPMNYAFYLGGQYSFAVNKQIGITAGAGVDMMLGKQGSSDDEEVNGRIGVGLEAVGSYAVTDKISVTLGAKGSIYFFNTGEEFNYYKEKMQEIGWKYLQSGLKVFAGATYKI